MFFLKIYYEDRDGIKDFNSLKFKEFSSAKDELFRLLALDNDINAIEIFEENSKRACYIVSRVGI